MILLVTFLFIVSACSDNQRDTIASPSKILLMYKHRQSVRSYGVRPGCRSSRTREVEIVKKDEEIVKSKHDIEPIEISFILLSFGANFEYLFC